MKPREMEGVEVVTEKLERGLPNPDKPLKEPEYPCYFNKLMKKRKRPGGFEKDADRGGRRKQFIGKEHYGKRKN